MRELVFALEFKGTAAPVPDTSGRLRAKTFASDETLRTALKADGVQAAIEPNGPAVATFESEVEIVADGQFLESGSIAYGTAGKVTFRTIGRGVIGASPTPGVQRGAVIWEVTGGEGWFGGAQGIITSNFTLNATGEVVRGQFGRLYLPS